MIRHITIQGYIKRHKQWSVKTFGEGDRSAAILKHIQKELDELKEKPGDITEVMDIIILCIDYALQKWAPARIATALVRKQLVNISRDWSPVVKGEPTEHVRDVAKHGAKEE